MSTFIYILLTLHVMVSLLIILVTLMQRPKNEGLGATFGGGMTQDLFGAQTSNVLATATQWLGGAFFALTLGLSMLYARQSTNQSNIQKTLLSAPAVKTAPAVSGTATSSGSSAMTITPSATNIVTTPVVVPVPASSPETAPTTMTLAPATPGTSPSMTLGTPPTSTALPEPSVAPVLPATPVTPAASAAPAK